VEYEWAKDNKERRIQLWNQARAIFKNLGADMEVDRMVKLPS
jgi:hypothetical protein